MRRFKIIVLALAGLMAMGAMAAGTASAAAKKLDLTWGYTSGLENQLKTGEEFSMANNTGVTFETSVGNITCPSEYYPLEQGFRGTDQTNNEKTDKVQINNAYGALGGERPCTTATPLGSEAFVDIYYPNPLGTLSLGANGKVTLKVANTLEPAFTYILYSGGAECFYTFTSLKASLALVPWGETGWNQVVLNFTKQKLKLDKPPSNKACPKTTALTASFQWQLTNETPEKGYFVFGHLD